LNNVVLLGCIKEYTFDLFVLLKNLKRKDNIILYIVI